MSETGHLTVYRNDNRTFQFAVKDAAGTAVDITGGSLVFTVKRQASDTSNVIQKSTSGSTQINITSGSTGIAQVYVVPADTASMLEGINYVYDLQMELSSSRYTLLTNKFTVLSDVTR